jgi:hypothetical protein
MPREVADALKKQGVWQHDKGGPALLQGASGTVTHGRSLAGSGSHAMIVEIGHYALVLALALSLVAVVLPLWGVRVRDPVLMGIAQPAAFGLLGLVGASDFALTFAYVTSDFSVQNVIENSHSAKPLVYRISRRVVEP